MKNETTAARRDEVLFAFHQQCETPTAEQIVSWTKRYPEFADDIRAHAAIRLEWASMDESQAPEASAELLARGRSNALNAVYDAQTANANKVAAEDSAQSFDQLMAAGCVNVPHLARTLDIERDIVADAFAGRLEGPVKSRFFSDLATAMQSTVVNVTRAFELARGSPRLGYAKASSAPTIVRRSYEDAIRDSSMSPERKAYWLEES